MSFSEILVAKFSLNSKNSSFSGKCSNQAGEQPLSWRTKCCVAEFEDVADDVTLIDACGDGSKSN